MARIWGVYPYRQSFRDSHFSHKVMVYLYHVFGIRFAADSVYGVGVLDEPKKVFLAYAPQSHKMAIIGF